MSTFGNFVERSVNENLKHTIDSLDSLKDVIDVDQFSSLPLSGEPNKIYITKNNNNMYRWDISEYVKIGEFEVSSIVADIAKLNADSFTSGSVDYKIVQSAEVIESTSFAAFPATGVIKKVYVDKTTNFLYRWTGSAYIQIGGKDDQVIFKDTAGLFPATGDIAKLYVAKNTAYSFIWDSTNSIYTPLKLSQVIPENKVQVVNTRCRLRGYRISATGGAPINKRSFCWSEKLKMGVMSDTDNKIYTSNSDLTVWTLRTTTVTGAGGWIICWADDINKFTGVSRNRGFATNCINSTDGITWTTTNVANLQGTDFGLTIFIKRRNGYFLTTSRSFVTGVHGYVYYSTNGTTWSRVKPTTVITGFIDIDYSPVSGYYVATGPGLLDNGSGTGVNYAYYSNNLTTWTAINTPNYTQLSDRDYRTIEYSSELNIWTMNGVCYTPSNGRGAPTVSMFSYTGIDWYNSDLNYTNSFSNNTSTNTYISQFQCFVSLSVNSLTTETQSQKQPIMSSNGINWEAIPMMNNIAETTDNYGSIRGAYISTLKAFYIPVDGVQIWTYFKLAFDLDTGTELSINSLLATSTNTDYNALGPNHSYTPLELSTETYYGPTPLLHQGSTWLASEGWNNTTKKWLPPSITQNAHVPTTVTGPSIRYRNPKGDNAGHVWEDAQGVTIMELSNNGNLYTKGDYKGEFSVVTGQIAMIAGPSTPSGWILCGGANVSRTTYARLFGVIGVTYGIGDGTTTFTLPNVTSTPSSYIKT